MSVVLGTLVVSTLCYVCSSLLEIQIRPSQKIVPVAIIAGPWVLVVLESGLGGAGGLALVFGICGDLVLRAARGRGIWSSVRDGVFVLAAVSIVYLLLDLKILPGLERQLHQVVAVMAATLVVSFGTVDVSTVRVGRRALFGYDAMAQLMLLPLAPLTTLTIPEFSAASFLLLVVLIVVCRAEFQRYSTARETNRQTNSGLAWLIERAGYVPSGHHARLSDAIAVLCDRFELSEEHRHEMALASLNYSMSLVGEGDPRHVWAGRRAEVAHRAFMTLWQEPDASPRASKLRARWKRPVTPMAFRRALVGCTCELALWGEFISRGKVGPTLAAQTEEAAKNVLDQVSSSADISY